MRRRKAIEAFGQDRPNLVHEFLHSSPPGLLHHAVILLDELADCLVESRFCLSLPRSGTRGQMPRAPLGIADVGPPAMRLAVRGHEALALGRAKMADREDRRQVPLRDRRRVTGMAIWVTKLRCLPNASASRCRVPDGRCSITARARLVIADIGIVLCLALSALLIHSDAPAIAALTSGRLRRRDRKRPQSRLEQRRDHLRESPPIAAEAHRVPDAIPNPPPP